MAMTPEALQRLRERISGPLGDIQDMFTPGSRVTLLVRRPGFPDGSQDVIMTDEDYLQDAIQALRVPPAVTFEKGSP